MAGELTISRDTASPIEEPFGPWTILRPGESRYFSFDVIQQGKIGLGVQGKRDAARCELLTSDGKRIADGVRMAPRLEPGSYILRIYLPPDETTVEARAVLAGLIPPGTGPPEDYIRRLLTRAGYSEEEGD